MKKPKRKICFTYTLTVDNSAQRLATITKMALVGLRFPSTAKRQLGEIIKLAKGD